MNDSIKKMLRIIEKDLMITEVSYETLQKKKTLVAELTASTGTNSPIRFRRTKVASKVALYCRFTADDTR